MKVSETKFGKAVIVTPFGRLELAHADGFRDRLLAVIAEIGTRQGVIILDFSHLDYISSAGLRAMMIASKAGKPQGVTIAVAAAQPLVQEIFAISRFNLVFSCEATVRLALEKLAPDDLAAYDAE